MELHPQFIVGKDQKPTAVQLSIDEWTMLMEELEMLADIRAYDEAKAESQDHVSFEQAIEELGIKTGE
ncbi:MAG: hypothetical protein GC168_19090 [Candidatus Hydrogenedens sp.]|nr:hypothetical protein [Candidatus Hydrogenedens sp.]